MKINKNTFSALDEVMSQLEYNIKEAISDKEYYENQIDEYIESNADSLNNLNDKMDDYRYANLQNNSDRNHIKSCIYTVLRDYLFNNFQKIIKEWIWNIKNNMYL